MRLFIPLGCLTVAPFDLVEALLRSAYELDKVSGFQVRNISPGCFLRDTEVRRHFFGLDRHSPGKLVQKPPLAIIYGDIYGDIYRDIYTLVACRGNLRNVDWESCSRVLDSASRLETLRKGW